MLAQLLHVDMQHRARMVMLIAANRLTRGAVNMGQPVQVSVGQDSMDRRRRDPQPTCQLHGTFPQSEPQLDAALGRLRIGLVRRAVRSRGTVRHGLASAVAVGPALHGRPGDLEPGGDLADRPALVHDEAADNQPVAGCESGIGVRHEGRVAPRGAADVWWVRQ